MRFAWIELFEMIAFDKVHFTARTILSLFILKYNEKKEKPVAVQITPKTLTEL